jgi:hypothetical protein
VLESIEQIEKGQKEAGMVPYDLWQQCNFFKYSMVKGCLSLHATNEKEEDHLPWTSVDFFRSKSCRTSKMRARLDPLAGRAHWLLFLFVA